MAVTVADPGCPFCAIVYSHAPAKVVARWDDAIAIVPLNPVTEGHELVIPKLHVQDALEDPELTGRMFQYAATIAADRGRPFNLITSAGTEATQTVWHLHVHIVPRRHLDGLALPWTNQKKAS